MAPTLTQTDAVEELDPVLEQASFSVDLHCHSEMSALDGGAKLADMPAKLKSLGRKSMGLTDHGVMQGIPQFYDELKKAGMKPILGMEAYLTEDRHDKTRGTPTWHLTLLAETTEGYRNLCKLSSWAFIDGVIMTFGRPRARADWELLTRYSPGVIALTGCMAGPVMGSIFKGDLVKAQEYTQRLIDIYGKDNVFGEVQNVGITVGIPADSEIATLLGKQPLTADEAALYDEVEEGEVALSQQEANRILVDHVCEPLGIEAVATGDTHYLNKDDAEPHDVMICIGTGQLKKGQRKFSLLPKRYHMRTDEEWLEALGEFPRAIANTKKIALRCNAEIEYGRELLPRFPLPDGFTESGEYLRHLCFAGLKERYPAGGELFEQAVERLEMELGVITSMGFNDYFLITWDLFNEANRRGIPSGPGRGSAAGSIVAYTLDITKLCPLKYELLFERFLNPDRKSMPDIDMDFAESYNGGRKALMEYARDKYNMLAGHETAVAQIVTFQRYRAKNAIKDAARVLAAPDEDGRKDAMRTGDRLAALIPNDPKATMKRVWDDPKEGDQLRRAYKQGGFAVEVIDQASWLEGMVKAYSLHAAAVIITAHDMTDDLPLQRFGPAKPLHTQYDMGYCERIGLLKMDFLGLQTLDIIWDTCAKIKATRGIDISPWRDIPMDDAKTFELYTRGDTVGTFQFESSGMRASLQEVRPTEFTDIIALVALYRPGAMAHIPTYAARKNGREPVAYLDDRLKGILHETFGVCITGDASVFDAETGRRYRLDELAGREGMLIQGVDADWRPATGRVTKFMDNGVRDVLRIQLASGACVKMTADHRVLTERGWRPIGELTAGEYIAAPGNLIGPEIGIGYDRDRLRILSYLIADGSLSSSGTDFVNAHPALISEYERAVTAAFPDVALRAVPQVRGVTRLTAGKRHGSPYHQPSSLTGWMRELGMKWKRPGGKGRGGATSVEKQVPAFVFELGRDDIAYVLASLWDCDGHMGAKICHYKTISERLAGDVQALLLRIGIKSSVHTQAYRTGAGTSRTSYAVHPLNVAEFAAAVQQHMAHPGKATVTVRGGEWGTNLDTHLFAADMKAHLDGRSLAQVRRETGVQAKNYTRTAFLRPRIASARSARAVAGHLGMTDTLRRLNVNWVRVDTIESGGRERVYDITVDGIHNFVANNVIVHNCVYQEQSMLIARSVAGFTPARADDLRKAIGKKKHDLMAQMKPEYLRGCQENGVAKDVGEKLWADNEAAADYSFNKSHAACYALISYVTGYLKANYPHEYMAALLTAVMSDKDKPRLYLTEAKRMGLTVLPPDINRSLNDFAVVEREEQSGEYDILFGLTAIRGIGAGVVADIREERTRNGPFTSVFDLIRRMPQLNKTVIHNLIKAGAMDFTGATRMGMHDVVEEAQKRIKKERAAEEKEFCLSVRARIETVGEPVGGIGEQTSLLGGMDDAFAAALGPKRGSGTKKHKLTSDERRGVDGAALQVWGAALEVDEAAVKEAILAAVRKEGLRLARKDARENIKAAAEQVAGINAEEQSDTTDKERIEATAQATMTRRDSEFRAEAKRIKELVLSHLRDEAASRQETAEMESALAANTDPALSSEEWARVDKLNEERHMLGIYVTGHPLDEDADQWRAYVNEGTERGRELGQVCSDDIGTTIIVVGAVVGKEATRMRSGDMLYRVTLEDLSGSRETTIFPRTLEGGLDTLLQIGNCICMEVGVQEDTFQQSKKEDAAAAAEAAGEEGEDESDKPIKLTASRLYRWDAARITPEFVAKAKARRAQNAAAEQAARAATDNTPPVDDAEVAPPELPDPATAVANSPATPSPVAVTAPATPMPAAVSADALTQPAAQPRPLKVVISAEQFNPDWVRRLEAVCSEHPGEHPVRLVVRETEKSYRTKLAVTMSPLLAAAIKTLLHAEHTPAPAQAS